MQRERVHPTRLRVEATPACQLKCPSCPTASGATRPLLGRGYLKLDDFNRLLDANPQVKQIELSNYGEMFLNPDLLGIMESAAARGVELSANNGVNLNTARPEVLEGLVRHRFRRMAVSLDGATAETYRRYRVGGELDAVLEHVRTINRHKLQYGSPRPDLIWQFIVFGFNEHEIGLAAKTARSLGMHFRVKLAWGDFSPAANAEHLRALTGYASREEFQQKNGHEYLADYICGQLWDEPQINSDGKVLGCCRNFWMEFGGDAFVDGLEVVANSEKMRYAREMLLGESPSRDDIPCTTCSVYLSRQSSGRWMRRGAAPAK